MTVNMRIQKNKKTLSRVPLILFILIAFALFLFLSFLPKEKAVFKRAQKAAKPVRHDPAPPPLKVQKEVIPQGKNLSDILKLYRFSPAEIHRLREDVKPVYDLAKIKAGQEMRFFLTQDGQMDSLEYDVDEENYLRVQTAGETYEAELKKIPYDKHVKIIWGVIDDSMSAAVTQQGEKEVLAYLVAELFAWDIDFYTDLRVGDSFKIIFEKKYLYGEFTGYSRILAAEFTNQSKTFQAFRFTYPDGKKWDYFDQDGNSIRKEFLKSPIPFARITSRFSLRRFHPIRKVIRPHYGVDYAARIGTQVQATADGTVTFTGWNGAAGRMIKIRHKNAYETMYLHLRSYAKGIHKGARVKGGQVIGYVGSSGESTGPHLDYRITVRGKYINPLAWRFKPVKPLEPEHLKEFSDRAGFFSSFFELPLLLPEILFRRGSSP